jgi:cytochrome P450
LQAAEYWLRPERFFNRCQRLGDRFLLRMPGLPPQVFVTTADDVRAIFAGDQTALHFGEVLPRFAPHELLFGRDSLALKDDEPHLRDRRMLAPHFTGSALRAYERGMITKTREAIATWTLGQSVAIHGAMQRLTLEIILLTIFGVSDPERLARLREAVLRFVDVVGGPGFLAFTMLAVARGGRWEGRHRRLRAAMAAVDAIVREEVAARRATPDQERSDVLEVFLGIQREHGSEAMSDGAICGMMRLLLVGGYDTTASTLAWTLERLVRHPQVLEQIAASVAAGHDDYVDAVLIEAMRVRPVVPFTIRLVVKPFELAGLRLDPGVLVAPFTWGVHRQPDIYPDPLAFQPERFLSRKPDNYAWIPFGGGLRRCLGGPLSMLEGKIILRTIFEELRVLPTNAPDEGISRRNVTLVPARGCVVVLERRARASA